MVFMMEEVDDWWCFGDSFVLMNTTRYSYFGNGGPTIPIDLRNPPIANPFLPADVLQTPTHLATDEGNMKIPPLSVKLVFSIFSMQHARHNRVLKPHF
jgi:hypothetical protein